MNVNQLLIELLVMIFTLLIPQEITLFDYFENCYDIKLTCKYWNNIFKNNYQKCKKLKYLANSFCDIDNYNIHNIIWHYYNDNSNEHNLCYKCHQTHYKNN